MGALSSSRLDNQIQLLRRVLAPRDAVGGQATTWEAYARVWAEKADMQGTRRILAQQLNEQGMSEITIRWRSDVAVTDRVLVLDDDALYDVIQISEIPRRIGLSLLCRTVQP